MEAVCDIGAWLASLGLSEYADRFAENGIDFSVLPDLSDQDLKEIGVILGHRRKILRAIADIKDEQDAPTVAAAPAAPSPLDGAERRQVTVMFSDLVGSTALSARMDPEDLRKSFRPIRSALPRPYSTSVASWRSTWAMGC